MMVALPAGEHNAANATAQILRNTLTHSGLIDYRMIGQVEIGVRPVSGKVPFDVDERRRDSVRPFKRCTKP